MARFTAAAISASLLILSSCGAFADKANEFKGGGSINLLFPFDLLGLSSALPEIRLTAQAGFDWHNDDEQHRHELALMRLRSELATDERDIKDELLQALRGSDLSTPAVVRGDR